jgi:serine phosphatase RsbU (regulator of sigma subunit)
LFFKITNQNNKKYSYKIGNIIKKYNIDNVNALNFLLKANTIYKEIGELPAQAQTSKDISEIYYKINDAENSIEYLRNYVSLKDSILKINIQKRIAVILSIRENEIRNKEMQLLQSESQTQKLRSYLLFGGIIIFISAFIIAIYRFNEKRKLSNKLEAINQEIEKQKFTLENKNTQIYDSIKYASTIQSAILPWDNTLKLAFKDYFVIYKPKDIVSGDFYWFQQVDDIKYIAVIDCTGHGIPGSMLTVIASSVLDDAVLSHKISDTGEILTHINKKVTEALNQNNSENSIRDGMEIALVAVHNNYIQFSTAGRPIYYFSNKLEIIKIDKRGIAGKSESDNYQYSSVKIDKINDSAIYLTTDGYADQMNEQSKKFSNKKLISVLNLINDKSFKEQKKILENELSAHKGVRDQIDDITIIGIRL